MADELIAGRYLLQGEVGRGASAMVYRAEDTVLGRTVALKAVSVALLSDPTFMERFNAEARLAARLDHPGIVTVYDVGTFDDGRPFISMKLIEGRPLNDYVLASPALTRRERIEILGQVASALDYIHSRGLVHRDVKPANIMVDAAGRATLMDFGIAVAIDTARVTLTGMTVGTPRYMSPEQVQGLESTPATDIYALGVIAFEVLGGVPPFDGTGTALMYRIVNEAPPQLSAYDGGIGDAAAAVVARALTKDPTARWPTAGEFTQSLLGTVPEGPPAPPVDHDGTQHIPASAPRPAAPLSADDVDTGDRIQALSPTPAPAPPSPPPPVAMAPNPVYEPPPVAPRVPEPSGGGDSGGGSSSTSSGFGGGGGSRRNLLFAVGAVAALAIGLGAGAFFAFAGGDDDDPANPDETPTATATATTTDEAEPTNTPTSPPTQPPTATPTPTFRWSEISGLTIAENTYIIEFITGNFAPTPGGMHVHFFFDTVAPEDAGFPGGGPWRLYEGPSPYVGYPLSEEPPGATQMCILVANPNHSINLGTGNCVDLP